MLRELFESGKKNTAFKNIYFIQTTVKDPSGIGEPIDVHFKAPLDDSSYEDSKKEIDFDVE